MYPPVQQQAYDRAITIFSPQGFIYQVEYALKVVERGTIGLALMYKDGVFLAGERRVTTNLVDIASLEKIFQIDNYIGAIYAGLIGDARRLVLLARDKAIEEKLLYDEEIGVSYLSRYLSSVVQFYTQYGGARPFGVSVVLAGKDGDGFKIFEIEPSGALASYKAIAIGKDRKEAMDYLEKHYKKNMSYEEIVDLGLKTLKHYFSKQKEEFKIDRFVFAKVDDKGFSFLKQHEIEKISK